VRAGQAACIAALLTLLSGDGLAGGAPAARIAIIIDDLGDRPAEGAQVAALPGAVTCAILPHTPHGVRLAHACRESGKEVMLHLPLEATNDNHLLGPGSIELDMDEARFVATLEAALASVPSAVGVNNHMGSLLTRHPGHMTWLMQGLQQRAMFFVDSRTTPQSVAYDMAREQAVPAAKRDVFLDRYREREAIEAEFDRLVELARRQGHAIAIGHPYPETLEVLHERLPGLEALGVRLVPTSEIVRARTERAENEQARTGAAGPGL
jgi:uncharacterized protein